MIDQESDMKVVGVAATGVEAVALCRRTQPDIVLLDLNIPEMSGLQAIPEIHNVSPESRIVILTVHDGSEDVYRALQRGAFSYLLKSSPRERLLLTIRMAHSGKQYIPPEIAATFVQRAGMPDLTPREEQVLGLLAKGRSNKQIGKDLAISLRTVKAHVESIFRKLEVGDRTEALGEALRRGILRL